MTTNIRAIDLFCGAGGLTSGLLSSGIEVVAGIDADPLCQFAYEANHKPSRYLCKDIKEVSGQDLVDLWGDGALRLLAGCAPCQPFSTFSQGKDLKSDDRWRLLDEFERLIGETRPEFVTMENVPSVMKTEVYNDFVDSLIEMGYSVSSHIINCAEFGVPQKRKRLVLIGAMEEYQFGSLSNFKRKEETVKSAISKLPQLEAGQKSSQDPLHRAASLSELNIRRIRASKPGGTWHDWPKSLRAKCHTQESGGGYIAVYGRMEWGEPAPTMTTQCYNYGSGRFGHPEQDRPISLREAAILQGFPPQFQFTDENSSISTRDIARMIGNAVPPPIGKAIGKSLKSEIL